MNALLDTLQGWIGTLPIGGLYALLGTIAFIEGIFPPLPADVVVALGSFLAARRGASFPLTAASIVVGSVAGAMVVYSVARRYGAVWLHERLKRAGIDNLEQRLEVMYSKYGMTALFVSRFLPGLRAITPPMAGATRIPPVRTALVFLLALMSGLVIAISASQRDGDAPIPAWREGFAWFGALPLLALAAMAVWVLWLRVAALGWAGPASACSRRWPWRCWAPTASATAPPP